MSDREDAMEFYELLARPEADGTERMVYVVIPGTPPSKARVRFGKGRAYTTDETQAAERRTRLFVQQALHGYQFPGNVALGCIFYRPTFQRVDTDNMLKHVCDSINGVAFKDDSQVTAIAGRAELDKDNPRTVLVLGPHQSTLKRGINDTMPCIVCDKPISLVQSRGFRERKHYCSRECTLKARSVDLSVPVACAHCSGLFRRRTSAQTMCSPECRAGSLRDRRKLKAKPRSRCASCGVELAHTRGGRCRNCWLESPRVTA